MVFSPPAELTVMDLAMEMIDMDLDPEDLHPTVPLRKVPGGDIFEAARAGDCGRLSLLLEAGANVNARDRWDSVPLYYACLAGHADAARMLLSAGAVCAERTFDGDRCHYAALNLGLRALLKSFEARPPPLAPLPAALRAAFLACPANRAAFLDMMLQGAATAEAAALAQAAGFGPTDAASIARLVPPDVTFYVGGKPIEAHRVILCARSPFFDKKFRTDWKDRKELRFSQKKLTFSALYNFIHFLYADRLEAPVDDMDSLSLICKVCRCKELYRLVNKEILHHKYALHKATRKLDLVEAQTRFVLQAQSLPPEDRLPSAMQRVLHNCLANSRQQDVCGNIEPNGMRRNSEDDDDDRADLIVKVDDRVFRCHQMILASRSDYFKARISRAVGFLQGNNGSPDVIFLEADDLSVEAFEKMLEYMYTDKLEHMDPILAEELFDVASRYLLFPLKRVVADLLLPSLEHVSPAELCHWLMLSDIYGVMKIREYCLDIIACNFETFAHTRDFRALLLTLPPPSGVDALRTTLPGATGNSEQGNVLDDLREKWLEAEAAELDERDQSAALFDKRLEQLMFVAEREANDDCNGLQ